ncbi:hypothetical protein [Bradyrhizobium sp. CCGB20]|uniref:hypothetical protein n=1 Tax=Bradyrhizobium sp. CCGB20 TaxID=2949633 RepID=UPI0020B452F8|nr:hypothetical protein [Bradyrhizobium sp. CCGB20]MCP3399889.1 hypothetical protein [Bradyrhizobium sp. CCGB20]
MRTRYLLLAACLLLYSSAAEAACNKDNHFDDDLYEWLSSDTNVVILTRERLSKALGGGGTTPYLDNIIADYNKFFDDLKRAAPLGEIKMCSTVELASELDKILRKFPK